MRLVALGDKYCLTPNDWTPRQLQLRNVAIATLSALLTDLILVKSYGEVSETLRLIVFGVGIFLIAAVAITALLLLALDRLRTGEPSPAE